MGKLKLLFLYAEVMSYVEAVLNEIVLGYNAEVVLVENTDLKLTKYKKENKTRLIRYLTKNDISDLKNYCFSIKPDLVYVSGRMDKEYLEIAKQFKQSGIFVVTGIDNQWQGTFKQNVGSLLSEFFYQRYFTHAWVPGAPQYKYATMMGFRSSDIIFNLYSGNVEKYFEAKSYNQPCLKKILFVGRITKIKGVNLLIDCFMDIIENNLQYKEWKLIMVGGQDNSVNIPDHKNIEYHPFSDINGLVKIASSSSFFCLPSQKEPWGVAIHEFAAAGMPLLVSDVCGAASNFLINGWNGFVFKNNNKTDLTEKLIRMMGMANNKYLFGKRSENLSRRITPQLSAASLLSILNHTYPK